MANERPYQRASSGHAKTSGDINGAEYIIIDKAAFSEGSVILLDELIAYIVTKMLKDSSSSGSTITWSIDKIKNAIEEGLKPATPDEILAYSSNSVFATPENLEMHTLMTQINLYTNFGY